MKNYILDVLSTKGVISSTRVSMFILDFAAIAITLYGIYSNADLGDIALIDTVFLAAGHGGKTLQSFAERTDKPLPPQ